MTDENSDEIPTGDANDAYASRLGVRFKAIREERGLELADIAKETRIPIRHLETLESGDYSGLPGRTYAIGFAKAYARVINEDEVAAGEEVRNEYEYIEPGERVEYQAYQPADPSRVPSRFLAWTAALVGLALFAAYMVWKQDPFGSDNEEPAAQVEPQDATPGFTGNSEGASVEPGAVNVTSTDPVVINATELVWIRVDDADGNRIYEREMGQGESYNVPADRQGLIMRTARPQALTITVGGTTISTLGPPDTLVSNVPLDPRALVERANNGP